MEPLFGRPARNVLADTRRAMEANRKKASGGLERPDRIEPEASREGAAQASGVRAGEERRDGLELESGRSGFGFRAHVRVEADPADRPSRDERASREDRATVVTLSTFRSQVGERRVSGARGRRGGKVIAFPCRSVTWEW
jgi:hypothetical protein